MGTKSIMYFNYEVNKEVKYHIAMLFSPGNDENEYLQSVLGLKSLYSLGDLTMEIDSIESNYVLVDTKIKMCISIMIPGNERLVSVSKYFNLGKIKADLVTSTGDINKDVLTSMLSLNIATKVRRIIKGNKNFNSMAIRAVRKIITNANYGESDYIPEVNMLGSIIRNKYGSYDKYLKKINLNIIQHSK